MVDFEIDSRKTALLVFDMINDFIKPGFPRENPAVREVLLPKLKRLIEHCRSKGIPIIYVVHTHRKNGSDMGVIADLIPGVREGKSFVRGSEGVEVCYEIKPQEHDILVEKHRYSAFRGSDLDVILRGMKLDTVIVTGHSTNIGGETTARDAVDLDYKVIFPSDGTIARDLPDMGWGPVPKEDIRKVVLSTLAYRFAMVLPIDELISKLQ
jgi:nicotinamidase-related amidase